MARPTQAKQRDQRDDQRGEVGNDALVPAFRFLPDGRRLRLGLESPGFVRLYAEDPTGYSVSPVTHEEWMAILDGLGLKPGTMPHVTVYALGAAKRG